MKRLILFTAGQELFAVDMASVLQIAGGGPRTPIPEADANDVNIVPDRRHDMARLLESPAPESRPDRYQILHVHVDGKRHLLQVERINGVFECAEDQMHPIPPVFKGPAGDCFPRVALREGQIIPVLDPEKAIRRFSGNSTDTESTGHLKAERAEEHG